MINIEQAINLFNEEKYDSCVDTLEKYATEGHIGALECMGLAYQMGLSVDVDIEKAKSYFMKAAKQGSGCAAHNLGTLYITHTDEKEKSQYWYNYARSLGFNPGTES
jgi:TPR repeat protein